MDLWAAFEISSGKKTAAWDVKLVITKQRGPKKNKQERCSQKGIRTGLATAVKGFSNCSINGIGQVGVLSAGRRKLMIDYALVFIYASFIGVIAVSVGTVLKPLFSQQDENCLVGC